MRKILTGAIVTIACAAPAMAVNVPSGTVSSVALFNPAVTLTSDPGSYGAMKGTTFEVSGSGGFAGINNTLGKLNGTLQFSETQGATINESLSDFFVFSDGAGGFPGNIVNGLQGFEFNVSSVTTRTFSDIAGVSSSGTLYLLGQVLDQNPSKKYSATAASLTIQFNNTGDSPYSSALTLSVPPSLPESATWMMMLVGFGSIGFAMRRSNRVAVKFA